MFPDTLDLGSNAIRPVLIPLRPSLFGLKHPGELSHAVSILIPEGVGFGRRSTAEDRLRQIQSVQGTPTRLAVIIVGILTGMMALLVDRIALGLLEMFDFSGFLFGALGVTLLVASLGLICSRLSGFWWLSAIGTAASLGLLALLAAFGGARGFTTYYPSGFSFSLELPRDLGLPLVWGFIVLAGLAGVYRDVRELRGVPR